MRAAIGIASILALCTCFNGAANGGSPCIPEELAKLIASDAATDDSFGFSVAVSGDTAVIGAYSDEHAGGTSDGSAYIFVRSGPPGSEVWTQQAKLTASDAQPNDQFGNAVAISGDTVLIGSHFDDHVVEMDFLVDAGSAYVFVRTGTVWTQQAKLVASDAGVLDDFGFSAALEGDTALIGAYHNSIPGAPGGGAAYVFVRAGTVWTQQAMLTASDEFSNDAFGRSVSLSGDTAVVGMPFDEHSGLGSNPGSAYVFVRAGAVWTQQQKLIASDAAAGDMFGRSVAVSGDTAVIGMYQDIFAGADNAAYVFGRAGTVWTQHAKLTASDPTAVDSFSHSVALSGNTALAGAHLNDLDDGDLNNVGAAYVFVKPPGGWTTMTETARLTASDGADIDLFGFSVSLEGDTAVVGAWGDNHPGAADAGSAYVFDLAGCGPSCLGDLDGGGSVTGLDLASLLGQWSGAATYSPCPPHKPQDLNQDCKVNGLDLALLLGAWGPCP